MRRRWVAALCTVLLAAGCGGNVEGAPVADAPVEAWDPCSIPADAIAATGLDPGSMDAGFGEGVQVRDWALCTWNGPEERPDYFLNVRYSRTHSFEDPLREQANTSTTRTKIGARNAVQYKTGASGVGQDCNLALDASPGVVNISVNASGTAQDVADLCGIAIQHAMDLSPLLPPTVK